MHLPRFEQISALKHHCGICKTPFSNPNSLTTCIGKHEVICSAFHFMFHFVGKAHTCKACTNTEAQQQKRHRTILLLIRDYHRQHEGEDALQEDLVSPVTESPHVEKVRKKDRKAQKKARPNLTLEIVKQSDLAMLEELIYNTDEAAEDADQALADALAVKFLPNVFAEKRMLDTLMAPPRAKPDLDDEANRVVEALGVNDPQTKSARQIVEKIKQTIREDIDIRWKTELEMKRRRIVYAQWVTQGAVANMAVHYEDWDINTGARTNRRYKGDERGKGTGDTKIFEDDLDQLDDLECKMTEVTSLTRAQTLEDDDGPQTPQANTKKSPLNDTRRGGNALLPSPTPKTPKTWDDENYAADFVNTTPTFRITTQPQRGVASPWATPARPIPIDLSVKPPPSTTAPRTGATLDFSSPPSSKSPRANPWSMSPPLQAVRSPPPVEDTAAKIADMLEEPTQPKMAASVKVIAKPIIVDGPLEEGWTSVGKKGKTKSGSKKKG